MGTPEDSAATLAVVVSRIDDLREDIAQMRSDIAAGRSASVLRGEWEQRNNYSDHKFAGLGREIGELRTELRARRAPWWNVAAVIFAGCAFLWTLIGPTIIAL
ncbi:hypothetical protein [Microbacterium sp. GXF7504]